MSDFFSAERMTAIESAIEAGDVLRVEDTVDVTAKASPDGKDHEGTYTKFLAINFKGQMALVGKVEPRTAKPEGKDDRTDEENRYGACDYFNYGLDLDLRAHARKIIVEEIQGPAKAIAKAVKALTEGGLYSEAEAREFVIERRKAKGLAV